MPVFDVAVHRCHQESDCKCDESFLYPIYGARTQALQEGERKWGRSGDGGGGQTSNRDFPNCIRTVIIAREFS